ncbi:MAG: energy-coupling factor transporter ATPase [Clostridia bacterium]|nr:energy-coupling factor transporter ATPase [Clostridia bacterium]
MTYPIELRNVSYYYSPGTPLQVAALKNINLKIGEGELAGIIGHTGSGKSTLISHFNGLLRPVEGSVIIDGEDLAKDKETLMAARFKVGLCFQYPEAQLFEETVARDIAFGPKNMKLSDEEINERVKKAAEFVGLKPELLEKSPFDLSGGEKRRAAIAGVMAMEPKVLVLDEPAAGLDPGGKNEILSMISEYKKRTGCTVVLVSHSMEDIASVADRVIVMNAGTIAMDGNVDEVFSHSAELRSMGLNVPEITRIFIRLRELGYDVPADVYSVEKGAQILREMIRRRSV